VILGLELLVAGARVCPLADKRLFVCSAYRGAVVQAEVNVERFRVLKVLHALLLTLGCPLANIILHIDFGVVVLVEWISRRKCANSNNGTE
jgi:hypothetical protein